VTFTFEMRSGREHNTPDGAVWGIRVTVKASVRLFNEFVSYDSDDL